MLILGTPQKTNKYYKIHNGLLNRLLQKLGVMPIYKDDYYFYYEKFDWGDVYWKK